MKFRPQRNGMNQYVCAWSGRNFFLDFAKPIIFMSLPKLESIRLCQTLAHIIAREME